MRDHINRPYTGSDSYGWNSGPGGPLPGEAYHPLTAAIERARNNPNCEQARAELAAFTHQPEPERKRRDHGWAIVAAAVVIVAVVVASQHWLG